MKENKEEIVILKRSELKHSNASDILKIMQTAPQEPSGDAAVLEEGNGAKQCNYRH